jgi:hypothetical protein
MALLGALKINLVTCVRESLVLSFYDRDLVCAVSCIEHQTKLALWPRCHNLIRGL